MMKKKIIIIFTLFLFTACKQYSVMIVEKNGISIQPIGAHLEDPHILKWKVGPAFKYTLSKGIIIKIHFPVLRSEDIAILSKSYRIDSWMVRVSKDYQGRRKVMGELYLPMQAPALKRVTANTFAHFGIYYAAAFPAKRFENFQCPAFNHRKKIGDADLVETGGPWQKLAVGNYNYANREVKVQKFSLQPLKINSGMSLEGSFVLELAAYSQRDQSRKSGYIEFPNRIKISGETEERVPGCENSKIPSKKRESLDYKSFKFGQ